MRLNWHSSRFTTPLIILAVVLISVVVGQQLAGFSSKTALAALFVFLLVLIVFVDTDAGLVILIFSMLLSPEISIAKVPGRDVVIRLDDILLAAITFSWLAKAAIYKGLGLIKRTPLNKAIGLYVLICVISTLRGMVLGHVVPLKGLFYLLRYTEYFLLYFLVVNQIHSKKQIKFFMTAFFITCTIVSVYGLMQIPTGERVSAPFEGKVGEPNTFGAYLLLMFCLSLGIFFQNIGAQTNLWLLGLCGLIVLPFLYTLSRASYVGFAFSFLALIILHKKKAVLTIMALVLIVSGFVLRPKAIFSRVEYTFQQKQPDVVPFLGTYLDPSSSARIYSWRDSLQGWQEQPILGRGITGFRFIDGQYILTLPELGAVGLLALLWLLWLVLKHSLRVWKETEDEYYKGLVFGYIAGFIGLAFHALTANTFILLRVMEPFWFITGIVMSLPMLKKNMQETAQPIKSSSQGRNLKG